ncbi:MAG: tyrosine-type recombinase/integrase [Planctomycetaceae bacterium]
MSPIIWSMIQVELLTGMRPGEVCQLRLREIDRSGEVWLFTPASHKSEHHGRKRVIPIGPKAQAVILRFATADAEAFVFRPKEASDGNVRARGECYQRNSYTQAVARGCKRAGVKFTPNQLRHTAGTRIREVANLDAAQVVLGHSDRRTTEIYAEADTRLAVDVIRRIG